MIMIKKSLSLLGVKAVRTPAFRVSLGYVPTPNSHTSTEDLKKKDLYRIPKERKAFQIAIFSRFRRITLKGQQDDLAGKLSAATVHWENRFRKILWNAGQQVLSQRFRRRALQLA